MSELERRGLWDDFWPWARGQGRTEGDAWKAYRDAREADEWLSSRLGDSMLVPEASSIRLYLWDAPDAVTRDRRRGSLLLFGDFLAEHYQLPWPVGQV